MTDFLHGIETVDIKTAGQVARIVKSGVIALIGHAPKGPVNTLTQVLNPAQDAQFGQALPGFNIPKTLQIIRAIAGNCPVLVVNVYTPGTMANAAQETLRFAKGKATITGGFPIDGITTNIAGGVVEGVDYALDFNKITVLSNKIANGVDVTIDYKTWDPLAINLADIVGNVDASNNRTGLAIFDLAYNKLGYTGKIFIAPQWSSNQTVADALQIAAKKSRGVYLLDAPFNSSLNDVLGLRGPGGLFGNADNAAILLYPQLKTFNEALNAADNYPFSAFMAGVIAQNDNTNGYWTSPSNKALTGVEGTEVDLYAALNDSGSDVNILNAAGITTVFNMFSTGFLTWGNHNASYPSTDDVKNFINIQRAANIVAESVELAAFKYSDNNINQAFIDLVREEGNSLFRVLIGRGVFLPGSKVLYNPDDNPAAQLAAGKVVFQYVFMVPAPAEHIVFNSTIDINLYNNLK